MASQIRFEPPGVDGLVASGTTIAAAAERLGVEIELRCGGKGECTTCAVRAVEEPFSLSPLTDAERRILSDADVAGGIRLGCQAKTGDADCTIHVLDAAERPPMPETLAGEIPGGEGSDSSDEACGGSSTKAGGKRGGFDWTWTSSWGRGSGECASGETKAAEDSTEGTSAPDVDVDEVRRRLLEAFGELPASERLVAALELNMKAAADLFGALFEGPFRAGEQALDSLLSQAANVVRESKQKDAGNSAPEEPPAQPDAPADDQDTDQP